MVDPKILFVNHSSKHAGAEVVLRDVAQSYSNSAVFLFQPGPFVEFLEEKNVEIVLAKNIKDMSSVTRSSSLLKTALPLAGSMMSLVQQIASAARDYNVLYANSQKAFILAAIASKIARKPIIWHCHDILSSEHFSKTQIKLDIFLANHAASAVIVPSYATARAFIASGGKESLVHVAYNGTNMKSDSLEDKTVLREKLGLPSGFLYGVFSRLSPWKGQHIAISALSELPYAKCVIVGDAQFGEDEYKASLIKLAKDLGVEDRVIFMGHRSDVAEIMQAVDVYCHPSTSPEPFSLAILEAMASRLPIIASNTGGIPEAVIDRHTGMLFDSSNVDQLVAGLNQMRDVAQRSVYANAAYKRVREEFTIPRMVERVHKIVSAAL